MKMVAHGRVRPSARSPGISPGRSRPSRGLRSVAVRLRARRPTRRGSRAAPAGLRSIFGARLRTRCPQYGDSVTYGLTSDPQFLQTTKRSAPRAIAFDDTGRARGDRRFRPEPPMTVDAWASPGESDVAGRAYAWRRPSQRGRRRMAKPGGGQAP